MHTHEIVKFLRYMSNCFLPSVFWIVIIFSFDTPYMAILTILTAAIHELGHISAIIYYRNEGRIPIGKITGFKIINNSTGSYFSEIIILLSGPLANLLFFFLSLPFSGHYRGYILLFSYLNLATALSNLIPKEDYDGYGIIKKLLEYRSLSTRPLEYLSFAITVLFCFVSLYLIWNYSCGYWVFGVFFISIFNKIKKTLNDDFF